MTQLSPTTKRLFRPLTGYHVASIFIAFFGVVVGVNMLMARLATSTFGGVVVENSYVASQQFNGWLKEASAEKAFGWKGSVSRDDSGRARVTLTDSAGHPIVHASVSAIAEHPLGQRPPVVLVPQDVGAGVYVAPLDAGRWRLRVTVRFNDRTWRTTGDVL